MFIEYTHYRNSEGDFVMITDTRLPEVSFKYEYGDVVPAHEEDCMQVLVAIADNMEDVVLEQLSMDDYKKIHADKNNKVMAYLMMGTGSID